MFTALSRRVTSNSAMPLSSTVRTMETMSNENIIHLIGQLAEGEVSPLRAARKALVKWALHHANGNVSQAAQMLGTSRGTIYRYAGIWSGSSQLSGKRAAS